MAIKDVTTDGKVVTVVNNIRIDVESQDYSIVSPSNSKYVIPAQIPANWTETSGNKLKIAVPTVYEGKKELTDPSTEGYSLVVEIKKPDGTTQELTKDASGEYYEFSIPATVGMYRIVYKLTSTSVNVGNVTLYSRSTEFEVVKSLDVKTIKIKGDANSTEPKTAEIGKPVTLPSYKYYNDTNDKEIKAYTDIKITCYTKDGPTIDYSKYVEDYKFTPLHKGNYQVEYTAKIDLFSTSEYKCEKVINSFVIQDVTSTVEPEIRTSYGYEFNEEGKDKGLISKIYTSFDYLQGESVADYKQVTYSRSLETNLIEKITYKVVENGVEKETVEYTDLLTADLTFNNYSVQRYIDSIVDDALVDTLSVAELETYTDPETSETKTYAEVVIPAIYAMDNYKTIYEMFNEANAGFVRRIKDGTPTYDIKEDGKKVPANLAGVYKFTSTGEKYIQTSVQNESETASKNYAIVIKPAGTFSSLKAEENPTKINFELSNKYKNKTDVITFAVPTATDKYDTRLEVVTYYQVGSGELVKLTDKNLNENGKYEIDLNESEFNGASSISIYAHAYTDYSELKEGNLVEKTFFDKTNPSAEKVVTIKILDNTETTPATIDLIQENGTTFNEVLADKNSTSAIADNGYVSGTTAPFDQTVNNEKPTIIELPAFLVKDANRVSVNVSILDENGREVSFTEDYSYVKTAENEYTLSGGKFNAKYSGLYTINYTLVDLGGNITTTSYALRVNDKAAPTSFVINENVFANNLEVGKYFEVPSAGLIDNGVEINVENDYEKSGVTYTYWVVKGKDGAKLDTDGKDGFTPTTAGTFELTYFGADAAGNKIQKTYTLHAEDTIKPVITITDTDYKSVYEWDENGVTVTVPNATVSDLNLSSDNDTLATVTVTNEDNSSVNTTNNDGIITFKATSQGIYTIKYSATDRYTNAAVSPDPIKIYVGDYTDPTIEWDDIEEDVPATIKKGGKLTINPDSFVISDVDYEGDSATKGIDECRFILQDPNGKKVTIQYIKNGEYKNNELTWTLSSVGEYKLTVYLEDENGREVTTDAYTITVPSEEAKESKDIQPVVGTILIVASVVILAGVVTYFIVSSKVLSKKSTKTKKDNKDNDKIVK